MLLVMPKCGFNGVNVLYIGTRNFFHIASIDSAE